MSIVDLSFFSLHAEMGRMLLLCGQKFVRISGRPANASFIPHAFVTCAKRLATSLVAELAHNYGFPTLDEIVALQEVYKVQKLLPRTPSKYRSLAHRLCTLCCYPATCSHGVQPSPSAIPQSAVLVLYLLSCQCHDHLVPFLSSIFWRHCRGP